MNRFHHRQTYLGLCLALLLLLLLTLSFSAKESEETDLATDIADACALSPRKDKWLDDDYNTYAAVSGGEGISIAADTPLFNLYLRYDKLPQGDLTLTAGETAVTLTPQFLHHVIDLRTLLGHAPSEVTLTFAEDTVIADLFVFGKGRLPDFVQTWEMPCDEADLLLAPTHADDDQLFFLGVLPTYAGELGYKVQVVYFTNHNDVHNRPHELLNGLWTVGVRNYPVIAPMEDAWDGVSTTLDYGYDRFARAGWEKGELVDFWVQMIRRFKPQVIVGHDVDGEYGHPQHMVNTDTLREAIKVSGDASYTVEGCDAPPYTPEKVYLHLWEENPIVMNWDVLLDAFDGLTAYQVSRLGYACHKSQQYTWFTRWLKGSEGEFEKATQITSYSPCKYGLYFSRVGSDTVGGDFFEHVTVRSQIPPETEPPITTAPPESDPVTTAPHSTAAEPDEPEDTDPQISTGEESGTDLPSTAPAGDLPSDASKWTAFAVTAVCILLVGGILLARESGKKSK